MNPASTIDKIKTMIKYFSLPPTYIETYRRQEQRSAAMSRPQLGEATPQPKHTCLLPFPLSQTAARQR